MIILALCLWGPIFIALWVIPYLPVLITIPLIVLWFACIPKVVDIALSCTRWSCFAPLPMAVTTSNAIWWHLSMDSPTSFEGGIDLKHGRTQFLGPGFYVWTTMTGASRYIPRRTPQILLKITAPQNLVESLRVVSIPNKRSWAYWRALYLWALRGVVKTRRGQERFARYTETAWRNADVVIAPALGAPNSTKQMLLRDTLATRTMLAASDIEHWDIYTRHWPKCRPASDPPALD